MAGKYHDISSNILYDLPKLSTLRSNNNIIDCKLNSEHNSSYIDAFFSYLTSQLNNTHAFIHGLDYYGSFIGNKNDLIGQRTFELEELEKIARTCKGSAFLTSAKTGDNVENVFSKLSEEILKYDSSRGF